MKQLKKYAEWKEESIKKRALVSGPQLVEAK